MHDFLIKEYINRMTIQDINEFAIKQGITLSEEESKVIYKSIKEHYMTFLHGNPRAELDELKTKVSYETYQKLETLYMKFKDQIKIGNNF